MNRSYRLIWSDRLNTYTVAAETTRGRGKRVVRRVAAALLSAATGLSHAQSVAPPAPAQLPTGGKVVAGQASIAQSSQAGARLDINQSSNRAAIDWQTFNVGSKAQVNFNQPGSQSVTLNRVLDTQASQIYGRITANGQVFLTNPNGVYFGPSASVDVGGLAATTHSISNADFMAGKATFARNGAAGTVVNQGNLNASIGGYIALLAPEVRNEGVIVAHAGTVALAAGEAITLNISGANTLAGISVTPAQINTLVENKHAIFAPGGLVILSAQAAGQLQGGVVKNSGAIEASGISQRAGRIVLDASHTLTQTSTGLVDVSGSTGGSLVLKADYDINLGGSVRAVAAEGAGGSVAVIARGAVAVQALVDVSGAARGGSVQIQAIPTTPSGPQSPSLPVSRSTVALLSGTQVRASSSRGQGGNVTIEGEYVRLAEGALIDARGATGGGTVLVGGDWQGSGTLYQATKMIQERGATIDASATIHGDGGKVVLWSDVRNQNSETIFNGVINASGASAGKDTSKGGRVETSGHKLAVSGAVNAGKGGQWLLDPFDVIISNGFSSNMDANFVAQGSPAVLLVTTLENALTAGTDVTVSTGPVGNFGVEAGNITLDANLRPGAMANDATLTLKADRSIIINAGYSIDATLNGNSSRLNVVLQANASDLGSGRIEMGSNTAIKSNGGNIILGGSSNLTTGYATGVGTNSNGRGIWLKEGTLLNAGGGDITLRGLGRAGGEGIVLGDGGVAGAGSSVLITESSGNITLNGVGTTAAAGGTPSGINLHNDVLIQAERGSVSLTGNGGATLNAGTDNSGILAGPSTRILSGSGPITLEGTVGTGVSAAGSGIRFASATNYLGHDEGVNLADSSSNITLTADALNAAGSNTIINTTGTLTLQPTSASFNDVLTWSGTTTGKSFTGSGSINGLIINGLDVIAGITLGKPGNTAGITFASPFALNGQLSLIGGDIQITQPLTIYSNALVITNSGTFSTGDGVTITAEGGISQNGTGFNSIGGDIITLPASMSFARELQIRSSATLRAGGDIILGDAVTGMAPGGASQLTLDSNAGNILLNGAVTNFAQLTLTAAGIALQSAPIQVSRLLLNGIGDYVLTNTDNRIGTLAANVNGAINLTNNGPLTIGAVNGVNGVLSANGTVQIETLSTHRP